MTARSSPEAAADFAAIVEYIRKQNPSAADRVANKIYVHRSRRSQDRDVSAGQRHPRVGVFASSLCCCIPSREGSGGSCDGAAWVAEVAVRLWRDSQVSKESETWGTWRNVSLKAIMVRPARGLRNSTLELQVLPALWPCLLSWFRPICCTWLRSDWSS